MRVFRGQAARGAGWLLHHLAQLVMGLVLAIMFLTGAFLWRLSRGPLEITFIARVLERAINADGPDRITIGTAALAWEGWQLGVDRPLDIRLSDISVHDSGGARVASLPRGEVSLSLGRLLLGRIVPRAVEIDGARLRASRDADGAIALDLGGFGDRIAAPPTRGAGQNAGAGLATLLGDLREPIENDFGGAPSRWAQLRRVRIHDAAVTVSDRQLGVDWSAPDVEIDLLRRSGGGVEGDARAHIVLGTQNLSLTAQAAPSPDGQGTTMRAQLSPVNPRDLAAAAPGLSALAALDATVTLSAEAGFDAALRPLSGTMHAELGRGQMRAGAATMVLLGAGLDATLDAEKHFSARLTRLDVAPREDGPRTRITATLTAQPEGDHFSAALGVELDQAAFADLSALWPAGMGGAGARNWVTKNITAGLAKNLRVRAALAIPADFSDATLERIAGGMDGSDLTVNWLSPVPPFEHADGRLTFVDPETIGIAILSGREAGGTHGGVMIRAGTVRITGLTDKDQFLDIDGTLTGPLADLLTVLNHPRIHLLDRQPIPMRDPSGQFDGHLVITRLPLQNNVSMDDVRISATTHLTDVHLGGIAAGRDLDHGVLDLRASNDGLHAQGSAQVSSIPAQLAVDMDFRKGQPTQTLLAVRASAVADETRIKQAFYDPGGIIAGPVALTLDYQNFRGGAGSLAVHADLARTLVTVARAHVRKEAGTAATADVHVTLDHDRITSIDRVAIEGGGISVRGSADIADGHPSVLRLQQVKLGATTDAHGEIHLPSRDGDPYVVALEGPSLDLSSELKSSGKSPPAPSKPDEDTPGPPYRVDARFDRIVAADGAILSGVSAHVENDGTIVSRAELSGETGAAAPFHVSVTPHAGGRRLAASAADAGTLLRDLDVVDEVRGGAATLSGVYDDGRAGHPLTATLEVHDFRVRGAAVLGKLLQALTLYGVADALSGPGLNFTHLIAPLRYSGKVLSLSEARAFSSSLGMTARGDIDFARHAVNIEGTVVPAYFFNTLLGDLPVLGKFFSPEKGGGLFAANYSVRGPLDDPSVSVNPLSILTPGFLRKIFGILDSGK